MYKRDINSILFEPLPLNILSFGNPRTPLKVGKARFYLHLHSHLSIFLWLNKADAIIYPRKIQIFTEYYVMIFQKRPAVCNYQIRVDWLLQTGTSSQIVIIVYQNKCPVWFEPLSHAYFEISTIAMLAQPDWICICICTAWSHLHLSICLFTLDIGAVSFENICSRSSLPVE